MTKGGILAGTTGYARNALRADVLAGLTAASVVIPKAMAMAVIAGLPVETGLYMALATLVLYPLLGTSRTLSVTTTSAIAIMVGAQVSGTMAADTGAAPVAVAATLALMVGGMLLLASALRLGFLASFISLPVLVGFEAGLGVVIILSQVGTILGTAAGVHAGTLGTLADLPAMLSAAHLPTAIVGGIGLALLLAGPRILPKFPVALLWAVGSIAASAGLGFAAMGVGLIGTVPEGLPRVALPDLSLVTSLALALWPAALGIAVMSFTESVAAAQAFRAEGDATVQPNRELLAIGVANLGAAFVSGMPAGGGTSQTAVMAGAGPRTPLAQWVNAGAVALVLVILAPIVALMPKAALGALAVGAAVSMIKTEKFRMIARVRTMELVWAIAAFTGVIVFGTLNGILIAVALSILMLVHRANHPAVYAVAFNPARQVFSRLGEDVDATVFPGLLILRIEGSLTFANAARTRDRLHDLVAEAQPDVVILECSAIVDIEYTALMMLIEAEARQRKSGVMLWLAGVNPDVRTVIDHTSLGAAIRPDRVFPNLFTALDTSRERHLQPIEKAGTS